MSFVSNLLGSATSLLGIGGAAAQTASQAANLGFQQQAWNQIQSNIAPFVSTGQQANQQIWSELQGGQLGQPFAMTQQNLEQTPGYQFQLQQGLESTQNAAAARGLGVSGAALKGAANFATGLANQNYQTQFQDYWANQNNRYNMLAGLSTTGANAATQSASALNASAAQTGQATSNIGNAVSQGLNNLAGLNYTNALLGSTGGTAVG